MSKINSSKLLPPAKNSSAIIVREKTTPIFKEKKAKIYSAIKPIDLKSSSLSKKVNDENDVNNKLIKIEKFLQSDFTSSKKQEDKKRKEKEKQDFESAEKKLELPKISGFKLPKFFDAPKLGFFDRLKRFLFFTALGWLFPKILDFLPKLEGIVSTIGKVAVFAADIFGKLLNGFTTFVSAGIDLKEKTLGFIAKAQGGNYQKNFDELEKKFTLFTNLSIIAGLLAVDIGAAALDEYNKWRKKGGKPEGKPSKPGVKAGARVTTGRGGKPGPKKGAKVTTGRGKVPGWWNRLFKGPFAKLKGPLSKFAGAAVPGLGAAVGAADAKVRFAAGDKIGGSLASVSAGLDALSAILAVTGIGLAGSAILAPISIGIDVVLLINDVGKVIKEMSPMLSWIPTFTEGGKIVRSYQGGGTTRGGKPVNAPRRRTYTPTRKKPFKVQPQKTQPGRDVGGKDKIQRLYPDTDPKKPMTILGWINAGMPGPGQYRDYVNEFSTSNTQEEKPNPYLALTSTSKALKSLSRESGRIPGIPNSKDAIGYLMNGIGGLMGAAVDAALGQKIDSKIYHSFSSGIGYLVDTIVNRRVGSSISSLSGFADGGTILPSRELKDNYVSLSSGDLISKIIGPSIEQRVNEAVRSIQKELQKIGKEEKKEPGEDPDGLGAGRVGLTVSSNQPDFWLLATAALFEGISPQGYADVAQAIYNRVAMPGDPWKTRGSIRTAILSPGQFQPVTDYGGASVWGRIKDKETAIAFVKSQRRTQAQLETAAAALLDSIRQRSARSFVGPRDSFRSISYERENNHLADDTEVRREGHVFGFEPRGATISSFRSGKLRPAEINREIVSGQIMQNVPSGVGMPSGQNGRLPASQLMDVGDGQKLWKTAAVAYLRMKEDARKDKVYFRLSEGYRTLETQQRYWEDPPSGPGTAARPGTSKHGWGMAIDISSPGAQAWIRKNGRKYGWIWPDWAQKSPYEPWHFEYIGGGVTILSPQQQNQLQRHQQPGRSGYKPRSPGHFNAIEYITGDPSQGGNYDLSGHGTTRNYHDHIAFASIADKERAKKALRDAGIRIGSEFRPGDPGYHGRNLAIDVPGRQWGGRGAIGNREFAGSRKVREILGLKGGGLIAPSKPNRPIPNSFASYETYGSGMMIAIQPIIVEKPVPVRSEKMIAFPVAIAVNSSTDNLSLSRG